MTFSLINRSLSLLFRVFDTRHSTIPIIKTSPHKPSFRNSPVLQPFLRVTPESENVPSEHIASFITALLQDKTLNMHNLMILRNGKILFEASFGTQNLNCWKCMFSACKSITSLAVGMLIDEGKLKIDTRLVDVFDCEATTFCRIRLRDLTVRHLLTMTSGVLFNEIESMTKTDWVKSFLSSATKGEMGITFAYNSLNTFMLSSIVKKVSGAGLCEYLEPRLFRPLGITDIFWERCPMGTEKGGWGLYIRPEDIAKIGQLYLNNGRWNNTQIVSESWIREASTSHIETPEHYGDFNYGYQVWAGRILNTFLLNGMFGQNVLGFRDSGLLIVSNAGNGATFQQSSFFKLAHQYFSGLFEAELKENQNAYRKLFKLTKPLPPATPFISSGHWWDKLFHRRTAALSSQCKKLCLKSFVAKDSSAASIGLLPVVLQALHNNYTKGLRSLNFTIESGTLIAHYHEHDETYSFAVGFDGCESTELSFHGEPLLICTLGSFSTDEDGHTVLKLRIDFIETACTRLIKMYFIDGGIRFRQWELPGRDFIMQIVTSFQDDIVKHPVIASAISRLDTDFLLYKIEKTFNPEIEMIKEDVSEARQV